jgi:hypothetical protein
MEQFESTQEEALVLPKFSYRTIWRSSCY